MKKILFLIFGLLFTLAAQAQTSDSKFWFGFDGTYWQSAIHPSNPLAVERNMLGSIRPMVGLNLEKNWSLGIITNFSSYQKEASPVQVNFPIYGEGDEENYYPIIGYRYSSQEASLKNDLSGFGLFLKKYIPVGKKTSLNFTLYGMKESGKDGKVLVTPDFLNYYYPFPASYSSYYCATCLSIAYLRYEIPMSETNWKMGLDLAFAYQIKSWLAIEARANVLEYKKQILKDERETYETVDYVYDPFYASTTQYFGNHYDIGSAVAREGIRFGLIFSPF